MSEQTLADEIRDALVESYRADTERLREENEGLRRELRLSRRERRCRLCAGTGAIDGFWFGTVKTCPVCHGKGHQ